MPVREIAELVSAVVGISRDDNEIRIRMGRDTFNALVDSIAVPPSDTMTDLAIAFGGRFEEIRAEEERRREAVRETAARSWGQPGNTFLGVPIECVETLDGWEVAVRRRHAADALELRLLHLDANDHDAT
jgi:hypothetical protein